MLNKKKPLIFIFLFLSCLFVTLSLNHPFFEDDTIPQSSTVIYKQFSTDPNNPTDINVEEYYQDMNSVETTYYIRVYLEEGKVYYIDDEGWSYSIYLYSDSLYSNLIKSSTDSSPTGWSHICFAPSVSQYYYIKWVVNSAFSTFIGVWEANYYTSQQVLNGVSLTFNDADYGRAVIFFFMPDTSACASSNDITITTPTAHVIWKQIDNGTDEAYNKNEMTEGTFGMNVELYNNPFKGFIMVFDTQGTFRINMPVPSFNFINPTSSTSWQVGTTHLIEWSWIGTFATVEIGLYKNYIFNQTIVSSTANDGSFLWQIPYNLQFASDYSLKINSSTIYEESDLFTLLPPPPDAISIISPSATTTWQIGSLESIEWISNGTFSMVEISLYKNDVFNRTIISSTENNGSYPWLIPGDLMGSSDYSIEINSTTVSDLSMQFTISPPPVDIIVITNPGGVPSYMIEESCLITWFWEGSFSHVRIRLYQYVSGSDQFISTIIESTANDGEYSWTISSEIDPGSNYYIIIDSNGIEDSSSYFTIEAEPEPPPLDPPSGGSIPSYQILTLMISCIFLVLFLMNKTIKKENDYSK